jgi:hypothetical protein
MPTSDIIIWRNVDDNAIKKVARAVGWSESEPVGFKLFLRNKLRESIRMWLKEQVMKEHNQIQDHDSVVDNDLAGATD